jgi:hypothetical protein
MPLRDSDPTLFPRPGHYSTMMCGADSCNRDNHKFTIVNKVAAAAYWNHFGPACRFAITLSDCFYLVIKLWYEGGF